MAEDVVLALGGLVFGGVEEGAGVVGPGEGADAFGGVRAGQSSKGLGRCGGCEWLERVLRKAGGVSGVGEQVCRWG